MERLALLAVQFGGAVDGVLDPVEQGLIGKGLFDEVEGAIAHRPHRHRNAAVAGEEQDRQRRVVDAQHFLQFEAAHQRHAHVEQQTARLVGS
jgi:hypothetical protein